jgi:predicted sulfurtransferase
MAHQKVAGRGCIYCIYESTDNTPLDKQSARYVGKTFDFDARLAGHNREIQAQQDGKKTASLNVDRKIASGRRGGKRYTMECIKHHVASTDLSAWEKHLIAEYNTYGAAAELQWNETEGG